MKTLRIATRKSQLALWQATYVRTQLQRIAPDLEVQLVGVTTEGDRDQASPVTAIGGRGVFIKALEKVLLEEKADIAVHSMKDVPSVVAGGLKLTAVLEREDPRDALLSDQATFDELPAGARIATSSLRRRFQLAHRRPDLIFEELRGNVDTRLRRLRSGDFDAIVLAVAGLKRLGLDDAIVDYLSVETSVPAAGQGAIVVECRDQGTGDPISTLVEELDHPVTSRCTAIERQVTASLFATCDLPVGVHAEPINDGHAGERAKISAFVADVGGTHQLRSNVIGPFEKVAETLLQQLQEQNVQNLMTSGDVTL